MSLDLDANGKLLFLYELECQIYLSHFITTIVSYCAARLLEKEDSKKKKKWILAAASVSCLGILFFFKYFNFVSESVTAVLSMFTIKMNPLSLNLLLPVGISFYTFQTLGYVIDVYRGDISSEHHFGYYAAFISFFPQLVAGPIERTNNLLPQIKAEHHFDYNQATYGLKLMAWGYFKKIVIADTLSQYVNTVYDAPQNFQGFALVLATLFFSVQIYCDFSGYSDIAIGTAKLLGVNLMTRFRDYVYIPLGGNRVKKIRHSLNLMITFLVSGLWHGANWTFVVWGGIHGAAQLIENAIIPKEKSTGIARWIRIFTVFAFVAFAWIFFVSSSITDACYVIGHLFSGISSPFTYLYSGFNSINMGRYDLSFFAVSIILLVTFDYISLKKDVITLLSSNKTVIRWIIYIVFAVWMFLNVPVPYSGEFIYFQF